MTFNVCNLGSKYPYFNKDYIVSSGFGCTHLYVITLIVFKSVNVYDSDGLTGSFVWLVGRGRMIYDQVYDCRCSAAELFPEED